ncbi:hypothetical protein WJX81_001753 [Elliptochloris bilobata]|uniref:TFIIS N-terminal domain-containing protein n=1 Tax=Elliptochloris bilobata TaxID=381761 RepID=A0AAW1QZ37_9CHLO
MRKGERACAEGQGAPLPTANVGIRPERGVKRPPAPLAAKRERGGVDVPVLLHMEHSPGLATQLAAGPEGTPLLVAAPKPGYMRAAAAAARGPADRALWPPPCAARLLLLWPEGPAEGTGDLPRGAPAASVPATAAHDGGVPVPITPVPSLVVFSADSSPPRRPRQPLGPLASLIAAEATARPQLPRVQAVALTLRPHDAAAGAPAGLATEALHGVAHAQPAALAPLPLKKGRSKDPLALELERLAASLRWLGAAGAGEAWADAAASALRRAAALPVTLLHLQHSQLGAAAAALRQHPDEDLAAAARNALRRWRATAAAVADAATVGVAPASFELIELLRDADSAAACLAPSVLDHRPVVPAAEGACAAKQNGTIDTTDGELAGPAAASDLRMAAGGSVEV